MGAIHAKRMHPQSTRKLSQQKEANKLDRNHHAKGHLSRATSVNTKSSTTRKKSEFKTPRQASTPAAAVKMSNQSNPKCASDSESTRNVDVLKSYKKVGDCVTREAHTMKFC